MRHSNVLPSVVRNIRALREKGVIPVSREEDERCAIERAHLLSMPGATRFDMGTFFEPMVAMPMCVPIVHSKEAAGCRPLR